MLRQNFGGITKSIMVYLEKGLLQLDTKRTQCYAQPRWPIIRLAYRAVTNTLQSRQGSQLKVRLMQPHWIGYQQTQWWLSVIVALIILSISSAEKKMIINKGRQSIAFRIRIQFDINVYLFSNRESYRMSDENRQGSAIGFLYF